MKEDTEAWLWLMEKSFIWLSLYRRRGETIYRNVYLSIMCIIVQTVARNPGGVLSTKIREKGTPYKMRQ